MSDTIPPQTEDSTATTDTNLQPTQAPRQSGRFISGLLFQALKWIAIIIGAVIVIVTIVVITVNRLENRRLQSTRGVQLSNEFTAQPPILEWYSGIEEVRGSTANETTQTFIVFPHIGYDQEDRAVQNELIARTIQIRELMAFYFGSRLSDDLKGVENRQRVKSDLTRQINRIMTNGKIRDVAFDTYQLLDF